MHSKFTLKGLRGSDLKIRRKANRSAHKSKFSGLVVGCFKAHAVLVQELHVESSDCERIKIFKF